MGPAAKFVDGSTTMRVLVTGHRGYIGAVVTAVLRHARYDVAGLDCDFYRGCDFGRMQEDVASFDTDIRQIEFADLLSFDAVIHLAGLSDQESVEFGPNLTREINLDATIRLAECCRQAGVSRFVFASTCAVYGNGGEALLTELDLPGPLSPYAEQKLAAEQALRRLADSSFVPVFMRNATVFGVSPRLRVDTVLNDFVGSAVCRGRVEVKTAGRAWRPLIHVEDLARAYTAVLGAPDEAVHCEPFNVAVTEENYRVIDIADAVVEQFAHAIRHTNPMVFDKRSYRVSGEKLAKLFPGHRPRWTLNQGIRQLRTAMESAGFTPSDWRGHRYRRSLRLRRAIEAGELDAGLRRTDQVLAW